MNTPRRSWKLVAGAFLHFVAPAYLVAAPIACLAIAPSHSSLHELLRLALPVSGWFLAGYAGLALIGTIAAFLLEPVVEAGQSRREARDPRLVARASERRVARAVADGRRHLGAGALGILDSIEGPRWDHADPRYQSLSTDLGEVVRTAISASDTAPPDKRAEIDSLAIRSLQRIEAALAELHAHRARLDEGDARTVARYIETRYGAADFAGEGP